MKGTNWFSRNFKTIIYVAFLVPIITVAIVSISHVTGWYGMSNPMSWALYLSIGIEIAALSALAAISVNMGSKVYVPFGIVTIIQFVGNIFFAFEYIDISSAQFLSWVDLTGPILEYVGVEQDNLQSHRRFLAIFSGGMLPLISLSFLHMLVKFNEERTLSNETKDKSSTEPKEDPIQASDLVGEIARYRPTTEELDKLNEILSKPKTKVFESPKNADEMMITSDQDIIDSIPSDDEESDWDIQTPPSWVDVPDFSEEEPKSEHYYDTERNKTPEPPSWLNDGPEPTEEDYKDFDTTINDGLDDIPYEDSQTETDVDDTNDKWDEDHALDMVLNDMVKDIEVNEPETIEPPTHQFNENIEYTTDTEPDKDYNLVLSSKTPQHVNGVPIEKYREVNKEQLPDVVETAELDLNTGQITTPTEKLKEVNIVLDDLPNNNGPEFNVDVEIKEVPQVRFEPPTPEPNFIFKEPINETTKDITNDDPEKKK